MLVVPYVEIIRVVQVEVGVRSIADGLLWVILGIPYLIAD